MCLISPEKPQSQFVGGEVMITRYFVLARSSSSPVK